MRCADPRLTLFEKKRGLAPGGKKKNASNRKRMRLILTGAVFL